METKNRCHSCGTEVNLNSRRCPNCYVALRAASRAPSPLRAAPSATPVDGQLALAPQVIAEEHLPIAVRCPACETTVMPFTGWCSYCMEPLPLDSSASGEGDDTGWDFEDFEPEWEEEGPDAQIIAGPWPPLTPTPDPDPDVAITASPVAAVPSSAVATSCAVATDTATAAPPTTSATAAAGSPSYATWQQRAVAVLIDSTVFAPALAALAFNATIALVLLVLASAFSVWQLSVLQGRTGQTIGKNRIGIFLVHESDLAPVGYRQAALRQLAHGIDITLLGVGYLWPLWDAKRQTFADQLFATVVVTR